MIGKSIVATTIDTNGTVRKIQIAYNQDNIDAETINAIVEDNVRDKQVRVLKIEVVNRTQQSIRL